MDPKASIIILAYKHEKSISAAIESVLAQQCNFTFEIIIGEDGSPDGTRHICEEYARRFPNIIRLMPKAPNKGLVNNYFDCLEEARGEYVSDCAGDDIWVDTERLQRQSDWLDSHPDDVAVLSNWLVNKGGICQNSCDIPEMHIFLRSMTGHEMQRLLINTKSAFPLFSAMLYRRGVLSAVLKKSPQLLRNSKWGMEDFPALMALGENGNFGFLPLAACQYNINPEGLSNNTDLLRQFDFYLKALDGVLALAPAYGFGYEDARENLSHKAQFLAGSLLMLKYDTERSSKLRELCLPFRSILNLTTKFYLVAINNPLAWAVVSWLKKLKAKC